MQDTYHNNDKNTPGTADGPGGRDQTLALKSRKSYAKIFGETNFHTREIPRSGSKAEDGEKKEEREKEREKD